jgi:hypothetical protein
MLFSDIVRTNFDTRASWFCRFEKPFPTTIFQRQVNRQNFPRLEEKMTGYVADSKICAQVRHEIADGDSV